MKIAALFLLLLTSLPVFAQNGEISVVRQVTQITHDNGTNIDQVSGSVSVTYNCYGVCYFGSERFSGGYTGSYTYTASQFPDGGLNVPGISVGAPSTWAKSAYSPGSVALSDAVYRPTNLPSSSAPSFLLGAATSPYPNSGFLPATISDSGIHLTSSSDLTANVVGSISENTGSPAGLISLINTSGLKGFGSDITGAQAVFPAGLSTNPSSSSDSTFLKLLLDHSSYSSNGITASASTKSITEYSSAEYLIKPAGGASPLAMPSLSTVLGGGTSSVAVNPNISAADLIISAGSIGSNQIIMNGAESSKNPNSFVGGIGIYDLKMPTNLSSGMGGQSLNDEIDSLTKSGKKVVTWLIIIE